jgi:threonine synthase
LRADPALDRREALLRLRAEGFSLADRPNPLVFEGLKTLGLELGDQLAERMPDWVAVDAELPEAVEAVKAAFEQLRELSAFPVCPRILAVDGEGGGDAAVRTTETEREEAARAATRALGLSLEADGAAGLAGLRRAVNEGRVPAEASAVVVVQGERARGLRRTFPEGEVVRSCEALIAAARLDPEGSSASGTAHG